MVNPRQQFATQAAIVAEVKLSQPTARNIPNAAVSQHPNLCILAGAHRETEVLRHTQALLGMKMVLLQPSRNRRNILFQELHDLLG